MAYTSSVLSFMLLNIPIPVVITGSQLSITNPLADAVENCRCAIHMAGSGMPGVFLAFDRKIMLGTRASKIRTRSFHAFESINYPYVGEVDSRGLEIYKTIIPAPSGPCVLERSLEKLSLIHISRVLRLQDGWKPLVYMRSMWMPDAMTTGSWLCRLYTSRNRYCIFAVRTLSEMQWAYRLSPMAA